MPFLKKTKKESRFTKKTRRYQEGNKSEMQMKKVLSVHRTIKSRRPKGTTYKKYMETSLPSKDLREIVFMKRTKTVPCT